MSDCSKFALGFQIYLNVSLLAVSVAELYFGIKAFAENDRYSRTFIPYWMCIVAALLILEQMISLRVFVHHDKRVLPIVDALLVAGIFLIALIGLILGVLCSFAISGDGPGSPNINIGLNLAVLIMVIYITRFIKFLVTRIWERTHNQGQPVYLNL